MLDSLPAAASGLTYDVAIVNNGEPSAVLDEAADKGATVIEAGENLGYGKAANLAVRDFSGDWLLVVNPDVRFEPGSIAAMVAAAGRFPKGGVFGPKILTPEGTVYPSIRRFPRLGTGAGHAIFGEIWPGNPWTRAYKSNGSTNQTHAVDWLSGACLLIRRQAFQAVGGFDENFFMFFEDTMLGEQMRRSGWQSVFVHDAVVTHDQGKSWREQPAAMLRAHHESAYKYLARIYGAPYQAPIRWAIKGALKLRLAILLKRRAGHPAEKQHP